MAITRVTIYVNVARTCSRRDSKLGQGKIKNNVQASTTMFTKIIPREFLDRPEIAQ
jgi:hypothetical protein